MARTPHKAFGRKGNGKATTHSFVMFQRRILEHPRFMALSANACKALLYLASQFTGSNNGDLGIAWVIAKNKGWTSNGTLRLAAKELVEAGFVVQTRQGGRNRCSLFALAWFPINECDGKLDISSTATAPNPWLFSRNLSEPDTVQLAPSMVQSEKFASLKPSH